MIKKYIITPQSLSPFINSDKIYNYIKAYPKAYTQLPKKNIFTFSDRLTIPANSNSVYETFYMPTHSEDEHIYLRLPIRFFQQEFNLETFRNDFGNYYILSFKPYFVNGETYLQLAVGEKKWLSLTYDQESIKAFVKRHAYLLFDQQDLIDDMRFLDNALSYTSHYPLSQIKVNSDLRPFITIQNNRLRSKGVRTILCPQAQRQPTTAYL